MAYFLNHVKDLAKASIQDAQFAFVRVLKSDKKFMEKSLLIFFVINSKIMKLLYLDYPHRFILLNLAVVYIFWNSIDHYFYIVEHLLIPLLESTMDLNEFIRRLWTCICYLPPVLYISFCMHGYFLSQSLTYGFLVKYNWLNFREMIDQLLGPIYRKQHGFNAPMSLARKVLFCFAGFAACVGVPMCAKFSAEQKASFLKYEAEKRAEVALKNYEKYNDAYKNYLRHCENNQITPEPPKFNSMESASGEGLLGNIPRIVREDARIEIGGGRSPDLPSSNRE